MGKEKISTRVALVSMPTLAPHLPPFQLALLKPTLEREGIDVQNFSLYMYFGTHIGWELNRVLSVVRPCMPAEWVWAKAAFGQFNDDDAYVNHYRNELEGICKEAGSTLEDLFDVRNNKTFSFIDFCIKSIDWSRFQLIGFSVVFQQMTASLALARALKEHFPDIPIIFGGGTLEDDIAKSIMAGSPYIDYIHCGDADRTFPEMVHRLDRGESLADLPGLMWRKGGEIVYNGRAPNLLDMDSTPVPDYDEYFYARKESGYDKFIKKRLSLIPIETARGCWWGMKNHCTFCGLNRAGMEFRYKSPDNVLEMLQALSRKYNHFYFNGIDNIMANEYIEKLFGRLAENHSDFHIHYEIRPHFSREQLGRLKQGGLYSVQPGIESFSTHVLKLMHKHTTAMRNVAFTKWCTYYGINNLYNILYGFPGETAADYEHQCWIIEKIPHYQPPYTIVRARPDRGSPMFTCHEDFSISDFKPSYSYHHIYPSDKFDLQRVAYYYDFTMSNIPGDKDYEEIIKKVYAWKNRWAKGNPPKLQYYKSWHAVHLEDMRSDTLRLFVYTDREAELLEFLNDPRSMQTISKQFAGDSAWIEKTLADFIEKDLVLHLDNQYLNLALPANRYI